MPAIRYTISFTAAGTIDSFDTAGVQAGLRSYLQCFKPDCTVELRVTQGSVNVEAVVTDTGGDGSSTATVEAAAALSQESEAGLTEALGVTVQGAVTVSAPSNVMVQVSESEVKAAGRDAIDAGSDEESGGLIAGAVVGCLALLAGALGAGFYCYKKKMPPPRPAADVEVVVSTTAAPESLAALLAACGLEHHEKTFKAEGYTLDNLLSSMKQGEEAAKSDLRELKLTLGECRQLINHLRASK